MRFAEFIENLDLFYYLGVLCFMVIERFCLCSRLLPVINCIPNNNYYYNKVCACLYMNLGG